MTDVRGGCTLTLSLLRGHLKTTNKSAKSESLFKAFFFLVLRETLTGFLSQVHSIESRFVVSRTGAFYVCGLCVHLSARRFYGLGQ